MWNLKRSRMYKTSLCQSSSRPFNGYLGWYHQFVSNFSLVAEPLNVERTKVPMDGRLPDLLWNPDATPYHTSQFGSSNFDCPFVVYTDPSDVGAVAVLVQRTVIGTEEVLVFACWMERNGTIPKPNKSVLQLSGLWKGGRTWNEDASLSIPPCVGVQDQQTKHPTIQRGSMVARVTVMKSTILFQVPYGLLPLSWRIGENWAQQGPDMSLKRKIMRRLLSDSRTKKSHTWRPVTPQLRRMSTAKSWISLEWKVRGRLMFPRPRCGFHSSGWLFSRGVVRRPQITSDCLSASPLFPH